MKSTAKKSLTALGCLISVFLASCATNTSSNYQYIFAPDSQVVAGEQLTETELHQKYTHYICQDRTNLQAIFETRGTESYAKLTINGFNDSNYNLLNVMSASGSRYVNADQSVEVFVKGRNLLLQRGNSLTECSAIETEDQKEARLAAEQKASETKVVYIEGPKAVVLTPALQAKIEQARLQALAIEKRAAKAKSTASQATSVAENKVPTSSPADLNPEAANQVNAAVEKIKANSAKAQALLTSLTADVSNGAAKEVVQQKLAELKALYKATSQYDVSLQSSPFYNSVKSHLDTVRQAYEQAEKLVAGN